MQTVKTETISIEIAQSNELRECMEKINASTKGRRWNKSAFYSYCLYLGLQKLKEEEQCLRIK